MSLSNRAMLVTLNISQWTARKLDRKETTAVNAKHGLTVEAARVNKNLLPLATSLERVHLTTSSIRRDFAARTLPWMTDGVNVLKADAYLEFTGIVNKWHADWQASVDEFVRDYPSLLAEAKLLLNGMFREEDYPPPSDIARRFGMAVRFMPVPDQNDWRIDVGDEAMERLRADITRQVVETEAVAMGEAWRRVHTVVAKAHERLSNPTAVFRDSLVENAIELCSILPSLNIADDPALERMRQELEGGLCKHNPGTLRDDPRVREDVAAKMADLMAQMGPMMARAA